MNFDVICLRRCTFSIRAHQDREIDQHKWSKRINFYLMSKRHFADHEDFHRSFKFADSFDECFITFKCADLKLIAATFWYSEVFAFQARDF